MLADLGPSIMLRFAARQYPFRGGLSGTEPLHWDGALGGLFSAVAHRRRLPIVVAAHPILIALAFYLAFWLRFDGDVPPRWFLHGAFP